MDSLSSSYLASFWSPQMLEVNLLVFMNLAGALALGLLVGYERSYHGRHCVHGIGRIDRFCRLPRILVGRSRP